MEQELSEIEAHVKLVESRIRKKTEKYLQLVEPHKAELRELEDKKREILSVMQKSCTHPEIDYQHCKICKLRVIWGYGC